MAQSKTDKAIAAVLEHNTAEQLAAALVDAAACLGGEEKWSVQTIEWLSEPIARATSRAGLPSILDVWTDGRDNAEYWQKVLEE